MRIHGGVGMKQIRYGIIGLGNQGSSYLLKIFDAGKAENAVVTALCDCNADKIRNIKAKTVNTTAQYFTDYRELLDSGLCDAVLVEVPHYQHPEMVEEALKRGIHVICEKPAGVYTKQVRRMNEAAKKAVPYLRSCSTSAQTASIEKCARLSARGESASCSALPGS